MRQITLALMGFGNVAQAFVELLVRKQDLIKSELNAEILVTGIFSKNHGAAINSGGVNLKRALETRKQGGSLLTLSERNQPINAESFIYDASAEIFVETIPLNQYNGQPALEYNLTALNLGKHVVTANKGPVVYGFDQLTKLAKDRNKGFYFESAVMDGAPIFSLFRESLPLINLKGFHGILNSCTNYLLDLMGSGLSLEDAVTRAKEIGITETDPSVDIDGWDAAIKVAALSTVLMGIPLLPTNVDRTGIAGITPEMIRSAREDNKKWKLVCTARRDGNRLTEASVKPQLVDQSSPLYLVNGTSSFVQFETDVLPGLGILEEDPSPFTTAYGLLADITSIIKKYYNY